jgi:hypothetical protein
MASASTPANSVPGDIKLWHIKGGGDLFESETIFQLSGTTEDDLVLPRSKWFWQKGLDPGFYVFHEGLFISGFRKSDQSLCFLKHADFSQVGTFQTLNDWYLRAYSDLTVPQWMTAGSGILHQEVPKGAECTASSCGRNLPANLKMTDPRYQDIPASAIPEITDDDETRVRGDLWRILGRERVSPIPLVEDRKYQETKKYLRQPRAMTP